MWQELTLQYLPHFLRTGAVPNVSYTNMSASSAAQVQGAEDCLFLDVFVSQRVFHGANKGHGAPVLVWIHGMNNPEWK